MGDQLNNIFNFDQAYSSKNELIYKQLLLELSNKVSKNP